MAKTKKDFAKEIGAAIGIPANKAGDVIDAFLAALVAEVKGNQEGKLELRGFGVFERRMAAARVARNPQTGAAIQVPARERFTFSAGSWFYRDPAAKAE